MEKPVFEFRKVALGNLNRLSEMYLECLKREVDESYFIWKYLNNPAGEVVAFEAVHNGKIAGFYGMIPEIYYVDGKEHLIYQSMDTMTHPEYQKMGLFRTLAQMCYDYLINKHGNVYFVGIPGSNSYHGLVNRLNWVHVANFKYLFTHKYLNLALLPFLNKRWTFKYVHQNIPDQETATLLSEFSKEKLQPKLDTATFKWKITQHPYKTFKVIKIYDKGEARGLCVFSFDEKGNVKIELLRMINNNAKSVIRFLTHFIFKTNPASTFVYTWSPLEKQLYQSYQRSGFLFNPFGKALYSYKVPFVTFANHPSIDKRNWFNAKDFVVQSLMQD